MGIASKRFEIFDQYTNQPILKLITSKVSQEKSINGAGDKPVPKVAAAIIAAALKDSDPTDLTKTLGELQDKAQESIDNVMDKVSDFSATISDAVEDVKMTGASLVDDIKKALPLDTLRDLQSDIGKQMASINGELGDIKKNVNSKLDDSNPVKGLLDTLKGLTDDPNLGKIAQTLDAVVKTGIDRGITDSLSTVNDIIDNPAIKQVLATSAMLHSVAKGDMGAIIDVGLREEVKDLGKIVDLIPQIGERLQDVTSTFVEDNAVKLLAVFDNLDSSWKEGTDSLKTTLNDTTEVFDKVLEGLKTPTSVTTNPKSLDDGKIIIIVKRNQQGN